MIEKISLGKIGLINIVLAVIICVLDILYINVNAFAIKVITSILFVVLGGINLIFALKNKTKDLKFSILLFAGLFFAMLGDIVLNINFIGGAVLFALGHILFFTAYCFLSRFKWIDLFVGLGIFIVAGAFILFAPVFSFENIFLEIVCLVYAFIIACMCAKSITNFACQRNLTNLIVMLGSLLFVFSDVMLLLYIFGKLGQIFDVLCIISYYPAEILLAMSIWIKSKEIKEEREINDKK